MGQDVFWRERGAHRDILKMDRWLTTHMWAGGACRLKSHQNNFRCVKTSYGLSTYGFFQGALGSEGGGPFILVGELCRPANG